MATTVRRARGYIMMETLVAMAVLSVGAVTVNGALRDALQTRGQAMDYTEARFILDTLMGDIELQPELYTGRREGVWRENPRFQWRTDVRTVALPRPLQPRRPGPESGRPGSFEYPEGQGIVLAVEVTLTWTRSGATFTESYETLLPGSRLAETRRTPPR